MEYRNELKYIVTEHELDILYYRLRNIMKLDLNSKENNTYNIRSIYFDDYYNTYFHENESGINERLKIRIRIYNKSDSIIKLEIKHKKNSMTRKESVTISKEICEKLINGKNLSYEECKNNKILNKIYIEQRLKLLKPKIIVEYDRTAFVSKLGNVRITFDKNIRTSRKLERFFENNIYAHPINELNTHVLEVKYDEFIPQYILDILELNTLRQTSYSKYYLSRLCIGGE